jgi:hypothetical protein
MPGRVLEELEEDLGVQKRMCPCASRSWRLGGTRGNCGGARAEAMRRGERKGGQHGVGMAAARRGNDAWNHRKAGGGMKDAATASGGEAQLGQTASDMARARGGQREVVEGGGRAGKGTWTAQSGAEAAEVAHMAGRAAAARGTKKTEEREREVHEGGPNCNITEMQGPYCNDLITFKAMLKWRWAQKQKCMVFQNLQLCFKDHLRKS